MSVELQDFSIQVKNAMEDKAIAFLEAAAGEIETAVHRNSRNDTSQTRGSWKHLVDESALEVTIGSPLENAIWEEFGTGEYADGTQPGRSGAWYVPAEKATGKKKPSFNGKVVVVYGKNKQKFYKTNGKKPNHTLQKSFDSRKPAITNRAKQIFGELGQ